MYRFCCDFRYLNSQSEHFRYAIPDLQELTESFTHQVPHYISSIDLSSGFFQMGIAPEFSRYTAFHTCFGTYKFLRLQMDKVLHGLTFRSALCYLDDVTIWRSYERPGRTLNDLKRLAFNSIAVNAQQKSTFLEHVISKDGLSAPPDWFDAIQRYPVPSSVSALCRFLGMVGWFRKYIPNSSSISDPLSFLLKKGVFELLKIHQAEELDLCFTNSIQSKMAPQLRMWFGMAPKVCSNGSGHMGKRSSSCWEWCMLFWNVHPTSLTRWTTTDPGNVEHISQRNQSYTSEIKTFSRQRLWCRQWRNHCCHHSETV